MRYAATILLPIQTVGELILGFAPSIIILTVLRIYFD
jgi:hypothetical protein